MSVVRRATILAAVLCGADFDVDEALAAGPVDPAGADIQVSLNVAEQYWGTTPCGGAAQIAWVDSPDTLLNATSTWDNPVDTWQQPAMNAHCLIALNPEATWDWNKLCTVVGHEVGHLLGHQHVADPTDLMTPVYTVPLPACAAIAEPEGTLTAALAAAPLPQAAPAAAQATGSAEHPADAAPESASVAAATLSKADGVSLNSLALGARHTTRNAIRQRCLARATTPTARQHCHTAHTAHLHAHG